MSGRAETTRDLSHAGEGKESTERENEYTVRRPAFSAVYTLPRLHTKVSPKSTIHVERIL